MSSSQWFTGSTGVITCKEPLKNVEITGFQIDGNCDELPRGYTNTPGHAHDCERLILLYGSSSNFAENITIKNMKLFDSFSDGIHIRFAENVLIKDNEISNTQHEGFYLVNSRKCKVTNTKIAGITSDCGRLDNCENCIIEGNLFFSYDGTHNNGAYLHGENGLQVGDSGSSKGWDIRKSTRTISTNNITITKNKFVNNGLKAILLDAAGSNSQNIYIHDNEFIGVEKVEKSGIPVTDIIPGDETTGYTSIGVVGNVSYENPPKIETSEQIFTSIFEFLNQEFSFKYPDSQVHINASVSILVFNNSFNPHALIYVDGEDLKGIRYDYAGNSTSHYYEINGEKTDIWTGDLQHRGNAVYLNGSFAAADLQVTCYNSQGYNKITNFNITEVSDDSEKIVFNPELWSFVGTLTILGISIFRNARRVIRKW